MSFWNKMYVLKLPQTGGTQESVTTDMLLFLWINMSDS